MLNFLIIKGRSFTRVFNAINHVILECFFRKSVQQVCIYEIDMMQVQQGSFMFYFEIDMHIEVQFWQIVTKLLNIFKYGNTYI